MKQRLKPTSLDGWTDVRTNLLFRDARIHLKRRERKKKKRERERERDRERQRETERGGYFQH